MGGRDVLWWYDWNRLFYSCVIDFPLKHTETMVSKIWFQWPYRRFVSVYVLVVWFGLWLL